MSSPGTVIRISGATLHGFSDLVEAVAATTAASVRNGRPYFGFDLHSFGDCLHGGYGGAPPFDIVIEECDAFVDAMGHRGLAAYCQDMLRVIDSGGRGLAQEDARRWHQETLSDALAGEGPTLLDLLVEVVRSTLSSLTLVDRHGRIVSLTT